MYFVALCYRLEANTLIGRLTLLPAYNEYYLNPGIFRLAMILKKNMEKYRHSDVNTFFNFRLILFTNHEHSVERKIVYARGAQRMKVFHSQTTDGIYWTFISRFRFVWSKINNWPFKKTQTQFFPGKNSEMFNIYREWRWTMMILCYCCCRLCYCCWWCCYCC